MKVKNCTLDTRNMIATLKSGARAALRLGPGEVSDDFDPEVFRVLRSNPAVDLLFKNRLICEWPLRPKPKSTEQPKSKAEAKVKAPEPSKKGKGKTKPKKLDLGV
jgi:hypothetical protein